MGRAQSDVERRPGLPDDAGHDDCQLYRAGEKVRRQTDHAGPPNDRPVKPRPSISFCARRTKAFTLVELIISTAIMAIILAVIHTVFLSALRLRQRTVDALDATVPKEQALQI